MRRAGGPFRLHGRIDSLIPYPFVQKLNDAVNRGIESPDMRARLEAHAFDPAGGTQAQFAEYVKAEIGKWGKVVRDTGAKPD